MPEVASRRYVVFVKAWELGTDLSASESAVLVDSLDGLLHCVVGKSANSWFPSPYGGAVVFRGLRDALKAAREIFDGMTRFGYRVSIAIHWGRLDRVYSVSRWNVAATAFNEAARLASNPAARGRIVADPKVVEDVAKSGSGLTFGKPLTATVKRTELIYHRLSGVAQPTFLSRERRRDRDTKESNADVVCFDIERYSDQPPTRQATLAGTLAECVELALQSVQASVRSVGQAGDGGYVTFGNTRGTDTASVAWMFALALLRFVRGKRIPVRFGIAHGPVARSRYRPAVGPTIHRADEVSSIPSAFEIAVDSDFWKSLPEPVKTGWQSQPAARSRALLISPMPEQEAEAGQIRQQLEQAPPLTVKTVLMVVHDKRNLQQVLDYFQSQDIEIIATPNTGKHVQSLGLKCKTTFEYAKCKPIDGARCTLHPYILFSIQVGADDKKRLAELTRMGLKSVDLVFVNTDDPQIAPGMSAAALLKELARIQTGGPSLLRWTLKSWRTASAVVDPDDYYRLILDLQTHDNKLSVDMRLHLLRRSMEYLAVKDQQTASLLKAMWPGVN